MASAQELDVAMVERMAHILGPASAAALALADRATRLSEGQTDVRIYLIRDSIVVGGHPASRQEGGEL